MSIPIPSRLSPVRDEHIWPYSIGGPKVIRVRLRVWPTRDGGYLAIVTDLLTGASIVNTAQQLHQALSAQYQPVTVVQHYPVGTFVEEHHDRFSQITLNDDGNPVWRTCTQEIIDLLGVRVLGYPGDPAPGPADVDEPIVPPASAHLAVLLAASLRLEQVPRQVSHDMDPETVLVLATRALAGLADIIRHADLGPGDPLSPELDAELDIIAARLDQTQADLDDLHSKIAFFHRQNIPVPAPPSANAYAAHSSPAATDPATMPRGPDRVGRSGWSVRTALGAVVLAGEAGGLGVAVDPLGQLGQVDATGQQRRAGRAGHLYLGGRAAAECLGISALQEERHRPDVGRREVFLDLFDHLAGDGVAVTAGAGLDDVAAVGDAAQQAGHVGLASRLRA
jgi:hypothetical protein